MAIPNIYQEFRRQVVASLGKDSQFSVLTAQLCNGALLSKETIDK